MRTTLSLRRATIILLTLSVVLVLPMAALAQDATPSPAAASPTALPHAQDQVVLSGTVLVPKGVTAGEIVVLHGRAQIAGAVDGDVVVLDGPITIAGAYVTGSVVALNGPIRIVGAAQIGGDVLGGETVRLDPGVKVGGQVREQVGFTLQGPLGALGVLLGAIAVAGSVLVLGLILLLIAPRGADRVATAIATAPFASAGWGVLLGIVLPPACVAVMATVVGLPLGLSLLLALWFFFLLGFTWTVWGIGRAIVRPPRGRVGAFMLGWVITGVIGFVPFLNIALWGLGSVFGLGAMVVAGWRARGGGKGRHRVGAVAAPEEEEPIVVPPSPPSSWVSP
jgi:hypothetical protein